MGGLTMALQFPDIVGRFQQGQSFGTQQRVQREGEERQSRLASLAQQAYSAPADQRDAFVGQAMGVNPSAGMALGDSLSKGRDAELKRLAQKASFFVNSAKAGAPGVETMYPQLAQDAQRLGIPVPGAYDDKVLAGLEKFAQAYGGAGAGPYADLPSDIRSLKLLQESPELAALDRERRQASGMVPKLIETAEGYGWGTPGAGIRLAPLEGVAGRQPQPVAPPEQLFAALGQKYGIRPTSVQRTQADNERVGGVPNSYHLSGQAADWVIPQPLKAQFIADAKSNGYEAIDEGDHIHIEPARGGGAQGIPTPAANAGAKAGASEAAKLQAQMQFEPAKQQMETQGAIERERGVGGVKQELERAQEAPKRIARYEQALSTAANVGESISQAKNLIGPTTTGFFGARLRGLEGSPAFNLAAEIETIKANLGFDRLQQMRDNSPTGGALGQVAIQELIALQSTVANLDPDQGDEQLLRNLDRIQEHYDRWQAAVQQALAEERSQASAAPASPGNSQPGGWGIQRVN